MAQKSRMPWSMPFLSICFAFLKVRISKGLTYMVVFCSLISSLIFKKNFIFTNDPSKRENVCYIQSSCLSRFQPK